MCHLQVTNTDRLANSFTKQVFAMHSLPIRRSQNSHQFLYLPYKTTRLQTITQNRNDYTSILIHTSMAPIYDQGVPATMTTPHQERTRLLPVQNKIKYHVHDTKFLFEALQASRSRLCNPGNEVSADSNRRLVIVGHAVLKLALCMTWYESWDSRVCPLYPWLPQSRQYWALCG